MLSITLSPSEIAYAGLLGLVAAERLVELALSSRNRRRVLARGGVEVGTEHYRWMVALHTSFFLACGLEVILLERAVWRPLAIATGALVLLSMALRYWAISVLGDRWNTRVVYEPGIPVVNRGPYRFCPHPNYVAVVLEIAALPLVHGAWLTAGLYSALNAWMLRVRIRIEEDVLTKECEWSTRVGRSGADQGTVDLQTVLQGVRDVAAVHLDLGRMELSLQSNLVEDLELDSIRLLTLAVEVENRFQVTLEPEDDEGLVTVDDLVRTVHRKLAGKASAAGQPPTVRRPPAVSKPPAVDERSGDKRRTLDEIAPLTESDSR